MLPLSTMHLVATVGQHRTYEVGGGGQWQRRLVDGVVGVRVRGGHGHHQLLPIDADL